MSGLTLNLFAGPGGWCTGARIAGRDGDMVGIEWDASACATARAAGHHRVQADVSRLDPDLFAGLAKRLIGSPPCPSFSSAGDGAGKAVLVTLATAMTRIGRGAKVMAATRRECARLIRSVAWQKKSLLKATRCQRTEWINRQAFMSALVLEPLRWALELRPEWIALEQVPAVLPLWQHMAAILNQHGYRTWTGILSAEEYGVPQTRKRAILTASRVGSVRRPEPTHQPYRAGRPPAVGPDLFGDPLPPPVSMAEALGWTGAVQKRDRGTGMAERHGERLDRDMDEPSFSITSGSGGTGARLGWVLRNGPQENATERAADEPAGTVLCSRPGNLTWALRNGNQINACTRTLDEPAGTLFFGNRTNAVDWVAQRPATTVQGDARVAPPGHRDREGGERQFSGDTFRVTVTEAGILQSFPADYPWQGTKSQQYRQVGDAVPPGLAAAIIRTLPFPSTAERAA